MSNTKVLIVEASTASEFQELINKINEAHNVFATQSHVNVVNTNMLHYTAILFVRGGN